MEEQNRIDHKPEYIESEYLPTPDEVAPRDARGRLLPGAQLSKMKKRTYNLEELRQAINTVEKRKRKKLLEHFISRAYKSDKVLIALLKKFVPDITVRDIRNTGNPFNVFITKFLTTEAKEEVIPTKYSEEEEAEEIS
jgi:hypothetical protein